jgi:hypothetical protein
MTGAASFGAYIILIFRTYPTTMGVWAEERTGEVLEKVGLPYAKNLNFEHFDVDAVAATPSALLAIETKWRMGTRDAGALQRRHEEDLGRTTRAAAKVRSVMRSSPGRLEVPVAAVCCSGGRAHGM